VFASAAALLAAVLGVAYSLRFVHETFFGEGPRNLDVVPHEPPRWMKIPVEVLVLVCVAVGVVPALTIAPVLRAGAGAILGNALPDYSLAVWHGLNWPLAMSALGVIGGVALYALLRRVLDLHAVETRSQGRSLFDWQLRSLFGLASRFTDGLANGSLQRMLMLLVLTSVVVAAMPFLEGGSLPTWGAPQPMPLLGWALWLLMSVCALASR
jgi:multicomponent K+:H+ antiporter subunit A